MGFSVSSLLPELSPLIWLKSMHVQRLEDLDEQYVNVNLDDDDLSRAEHHHQGIFSALRNCTLRFLKANFFLTLGYLWSYVSWGSQYYPCR